MDTTPAIPPESGREEEASSAAPSLLEEEVSASPFTKELAPSPAALPWRVSWET